MCASRQLQYDTASGKTSSDMTSHSSSTYYRDGMNDDTEDEESADYPSSESWEPTPGPRRRPKSGVGVPVLPKKKMIRTASPGQKGGKRGRAQHDETPKALVLRKRMVVTKQVVMPTVASKKRRRISHSNDQVSPQPRKMAPQVLVVQQVTEIVRTIEAPAMQVHTPELPGRNRVCMHEATSGEKADQATGSAPYQLQLQLTVNEATRHDTLEQL